MLGVCDLTSYFSCEAEVALVDQVADVDESVFLLKAAASAGHARDDHTHDNEEGLAVLFQLLVPPPELLEEGLELLVLLNIPDHRLVQFVDIELELVVEGLSVETHLFLFL